MLIYYCLVFVGATRNNNDNIKQIERPLTKWYYPYNLFGFVLVLKFMRY